MFKSGICYVRAIGFVIAAVVVFSCGQRKLTVEDLVDSGNKLDATAALLGGEWEGYFQELNPSYDTLFFNSVDEKLEFMLSGSVSDSSLLKEVTVRDTFQVKPVHIDFGTLDRQDWSGVAQITFPEADSTISVPLGLDLATYLSDGSRQITFGSTDETNPLRLFDRLQHDSFQRAFSSPAFNLVINSLSADSLVFSLPAGYGKMVLVKKK